MAKSIKIPLVSVVMSVYNGERYLDEAVKSILAQTFKNFEFIIIDDGSTDDTSILLRKYTDSRVRIITQENKGLVASLNLGISEARGKYIARQDADDRSEPKRLELQVAYLQKNPRVILVGSGMSVMNSTSTITHTHSVLLNNSELKQELLVRSPFAHGSVLFEKNAAVDSGLYDQSKWPAEDYDLWLRLSDKGMFANLDEYLYVYRENENGISSTNKEIQVQQKNDAQKRAWELRKKLLNSKIDIKSYNELDLDITRTERIINTTAWISHKAWKRLSVKTGFENILLLKSSPRSMFSALKRSIKGIKI